MTVKHTLITSRTLLLWSSIVISMPALGGGLSQKYQESIARLRNQQDAGCRMLSTKSQSAPDQCGACGNEPCADNEHLEPKNGHLFKDMKEHHENSGEKRIYSEIRRP